MAGTDSSVILSGLMPNTEYKVRVSASNSLGKSKPSHELLIRTDEEGEFLSVFLRNEKRSLVFAVTFVSLTFDVLMTK